MGVGSFYTALKTAFSFLGNPGEHFSSLQKKTLEEVVGYYARVLLSMAVITALLNVIFWLVRSAYYDMFFNTSIDYFRMMNYMLGTSSSLLFFYVYAGSFLLLLFSVIVYFFTRNMKYTDLLKILMYATTPLLLFGWVPPSPIPIAIWSVFLLVFGIKSHKAVKVKKDSVHNRD